MSSNGRLKQSELGKITRATNGQQAYLRKDAAKAFMAMNAESVRRYGVNLRVSSARTAYRTYAQQEYFWNLYQSGRGNLAARPGTSNHGLGLAVDLATQLMRTIVNKIGAKYGFAKKWSDAANEWWHIKWKPGNYSAVNKKPKDRLAGYTKREVKWIRNYDSWFRRGVNPDGRKRLRVEMRKQRKRIWRLAQPKSRGGDGHGWTALRSKRYKSLLSRSR